MAITLRQDSATGATTKGSSLTFSELDQNFVDLLSNKIQALDLNGDSGQTTVGQALANEKVTIAGGTGIQTALTTDSAGETTVTISSIASDNNTTYTFGATQDGSDANITLSGSDATTDSVQLAAGLGIQLQVDSAGQVTISSTVADNDTTYSISAESVSGGANLRLTDSGAGTDDVKFQAGTGILISRTDANTIQIDNTASDSNTTYTYGLTTDISGDIDMTLTGSDASTDIIRFSAGSNITLTADSAGQMTIAATDTGITDVVSDTTPQLGGDLDGQGNKVQDVQLENYKETVYTGGTTTGTITPDVANGNVQSITLSGNITWNAFGNAEAGQSMTMIIKQPGSGGPHTLTSTMNFAGGTNTLSTDANAVDIMSVVYDGTNYYASLSTNFS